MPVYMMQYKEERTTVARIGMDGFEIKTRLNNNQALEAGKPVSLIVNVKVKKDASLNSGKEFVMIEIPIPGSCSYE